VRRFLSLVTFSHTVFALPFAMLAAVLAAEGVPPLRTLAGILAAMVGARSAAMAFNRIVDRDVDAENPRTARREIPRGAVSVAAAGAFCAFSAAVFVAAAWFLNPLCLALSPLALAIVLGYSFTKRLSALSHLVLGLGLAIAPVGAWIDVIYSLQDEAFDRAHGLFSLPARVGARRALDVSTVFHAVSLSLLYGVFVLAGGGPLFGAGVVMAGVFLVRQHVLVSETDLSRVNGAFFSANGWLSVAVFLCGALDVLFRR